MKKVLSIVFVLAIAAMCCFGVTGCGGNTTSGNSDASQTSGTASAGTDLSKVKVGFIFLHDPASSTYDNNFYQAALAVKEELGLTDKQMVFKWNVPEEGTECHDTACEMVDEGCNLVFADSFGHESNMKLAASEIPNVQFCHATGTQAIVTDSKNYHNAFAAIYEGRYLAGVAAGLKINEMIESGKITADKAKIGYVGAHPYAEVKSGYTSFFLGARSVCPTATMDVVFTNSWFDIALEKEAALNLINDGCVLISQHADSEGAPKACEEKGVPNVAYNVSTIDIAPNTALIASKINWAPYFKMIIEATAKGEEFAKDWCGSFATGSVELLGMNDKVIAAGTKEKLEEVKKKIEDGTLHVFDTSTFTVKGQPLTSYLADVEDMSDFKGETEVIKDGYFHESEGRSAPYFDIDIDGITLK